jgi:ATP-dependent DNA helicase RecG
MIEAWLYTLLSSATETELLEFKEAKQFYSKDKLGVYFSALSSEANLKGKTCAYILFGVNNNREIVGTTITETILSSIKNI